MSTISIDQLQVSHHLN